MLRDDGLGPACRIQWDCYIIKLGWIGKTVQGVHVKKGIVTSGVWSGEDNVGVVEQCVRLSAGVSARCCAVCCLIKFGNYKIIPST